jgi:hypothetical protein
MVKMGFTRYTEEEKAAYLREFYGAGEEYTVKASVSAWEPKDANPLTARVIPMVKYYDPVNMLVFRSGIDREGEVIFLRRWNDNALQLRESFEGAYGKAETDRYLAECLRENRKPYPVGECETIKGEGAGKESNASMVPV